MFLSQKLKELRKEKRVTQIELANKAGIGVNSVARYEKGERTPDIETTIKLAKALGVDPSILLDGETKYLFQDLFDGQKGGQFLQEQKILNSIDGPLIDISPQYGMLNILGRKIINGHIDYLSTLPECTAPDSSTASDHEEGEGADKTDTPR